MWQRFLLMSQKHYQVWAWRTTSKSLLLPPAVTKSFSADVVTLTPPHAPFLTPPQLLLAFLFKAAFVSSRASWHKYLGDLLATCTGCVPGKHGVTPFTRRKRERRWGEKKLACDGSWRVKRACKPGGKTDKKKTTDICPSHSLFEWTKPSTPRS